jgi:hypothetical protein
MLRGKPKTLLVLNLTNIRIVKLDRPFSLPFAKGRETKRVSSLCCVPKLFQKEPMNSFMLNSGDGLKSSLSKNLVFNYLNSQLRYDTILLTYAVFQ